MDELVVLELRFSVDSGGDGGGNRGQPSTWTEGLQVLDLMEMTEWD